MGPHHAPAVPEYAVYSPPLPSPFASVKNCAEVASMPAAVNCTDTDDAAPLATSMANGTPPPCGRATVPDARSADPTTATTPMVSLHRRDAGRRHALGHPHHATPDNLRERHRVGVADVEIVTQHAHRLPALPP